MKSIPVVHSLVVWKGSGVGPQPLAAPARPLLPPPPPNSCGGKDTNKKIAFLRAKSGAFGAPSYRTGTGGIGNQKVKFVYFGYQKSTNILAGTVSLTL